MNIERGRIYRVNLEPTIGHEQQGDARPCVVISRTALNDRTSTVLVVPLTTSARPALPPVLIPVTSMGKPALALLLQTRSIDKARILSAAGTLSISDLKNIEDALREVCDL